ncbi:Mediator of RNA polymerase II transcription subunit [Fasciola gigantica]|uniref:Mediator of RNA polymerase II transcription subunit 22 n=1 Tax=Fasciola gigantica TaxID=46835 RepID=A0A504YZ59_FASGI|nr:Mediator of RNA polymerase II transcription subunit [Fasciola gigantica]
MQSAQRGPAVLQLNAARKRDSHVQSLKTRLRKNMNAITENYELILSRAKVDTNDNSAILGAYAQAEQDTYEMSVRAANIVHACENLTRLVSEIKQLLILGDFCWLATTTATASEELRKRRADLDRVSTRLRDKLAADLYAIEEECGTPLIQAPSQPAAAAASSATTMTASIISSLSETSGSNVMNPASTAPLPMLNTKLK